MTTTAQTAFRRALLDAGLPPPAGLSDGQGRAVGKRFDVYRNNVVQGLIDAMADSFPVIAKLIGEGNFSGLAAIFIRAHPPKSPLMMFYGIDFPDFLANFEPLQHLGYLPDMARLELALRTSYHATDGTPIAADVLKNMPPDNLMKARLSLAPAVQVMSSDWPIYSIWRFNMIDGAPPPKMQAEALIVLRAGFDAEPHLLPIGGAAFLDAIWTGATFGNALEAAKGLDLAAMLGLLLTGEAITEITIRDIT